MLSRTNIMKKYILSIFSISLWLLAFPPGCHGQSRDYVKRFNNGKRCYFAAVNACKKGDQQTATSQMNTALNYFQSAKHYASQNEKANVNIWIKRCKTYPFNCTIAARQKPGPSAPLRHSMSQKWDIEWQDSNRSIVITNEQGQKFTYQMKYVTTAKDDDSDSGFLIGCTEVTTILWNVVMKRIGSSQPYHPVSGVSWNDCMTFIDKLNKITGKQFRLPEESEWEFAAKGGIYSKGYIFSGANDLDKITWCDLKIHKVASREPNELELYDMTGNVWEWCATLYGNDYIMKGGSCADAGFKVEKKLLVSQKEHQPANYKGPYCGLRLCM